jgi:hypothetical protein
MEQLKAALRGYDEEKALLEQGSPTSKEQVAQEKKRIK